MVRVIASNNFNKMNALQSFHKLPLEHRDVFTVSYTQIKALLYRHCTKQIILFGNTAVKQSDPTLKHFYRKKQLFQDQRDLPQDSGTPREINRGLSLR